MKASRLVEKLNDAIKEYGDLDVVVAYDGCHAKITEKGRPDDGFGPRVLTVVPVGMPTTLLTEMTLDGTEYRGPRVFEL